MSTHNYLRTSIKISCIIVLFIAGNHLSQELIQLIDFEITPANEASVRRAIVISMVAFTILMAIPFVPGAEIGLGVMMILGPKIVPLVFLCSIMSLSISFLIGTFISDRALINFFNDLRLHRASRFLMKIKGLSPQQRFDLLINNSPKKMIPFILKHRYIALIIIINIPGNIIIGGGGGISLIAGMSRLFKPILFIVSVAIAVSPIPILILTFGSDLSNWPV